MAGNTEVYAVKGIERVDPEKLFFVGGFRLATMDLDRMFAGQFETEVPESRRPFVKRAGEIGLQLAFVSNAFGERVDRVRAFAAAVSEISGSECFSVVPDDVDGKKKPYPHMMHRALEIAGVGPRRAIHFGDQVRSDVVAAERAGFRTAVLTKPIGEEDDFWVEHVGRPLFEPRLRRARSLPDRVEDFPDHLPEAAYRFVR